MVKIVLSGGWKALIGKTGVHLSAETGTVGQALDHLTREYPVLRQRIFNKSGRINSFVNVYLDDSDVRYLDAGLETMCSEGSEIVVIPALAGG